MIEKVLVIVYKMKGDQPLFFIGKRPKSKLYQPVTGHRESEDKTISETVRRELEEETGVKNFRNFINLKESFNWRRDKSDVRESVFAVEIGEDEIELEKKEFESFEFLPCLEAVQKVKYESHKKYLDEVSKMVETKSYPKIFIICGPGGSGKGTIIKALSERYPDLLAVSPTSTTRPRRPGEKTTSRIFLTEKEFDDLYKGGGLVEKNLFKGYWFGAPKEEIYKILGDGKNVIMEVDLNGVKSFRKSFSNVVAVFIDAHFDEFEKRMKERGQETPEEIAIRMKITKWELQNKHICDYIVENKQGKLKDAIGEIANIIKRKDKNMRNPTTVIIFIALIGLVLGGILLSSPNKSQAPTGDQTAQSSVKEDASLIYRDGGPRVGPDNAKVKVVIFTDYLCPYCKNTHELMKSILAAHPNDVALYARNFVVHPEAEIMAKAAEAAAKQGKFQQADDAIFENYQTADEAEMIKMAESIGLNIDQFKSDLASQSIADAVSKDYSDATSLNLQGTPSVYVDGKYLENPAQLEDTINGLL